MKKILILLFSVGLLSSCGTLFNVTKTKNVETEEERWTRIIDEAWEKTVTSQGKDYLFEDVSLKVDTINNK